MPRPSLSVVGRTSGNQVLVQVSPGFMPRPSLSVRFNDLSRLVTKGVAGVYAPAFVERVTMSLAYHLPARVSPGFMPRPSLSAGLSIRNIAYFHVSPGFMPRPSLSVHL